MIVIIGLLKKLNFIKRFVNFQLKKKTLITEIIYREKKIFI